MKATWTDLKFSTSARCGCFDNYDSTTILTTFSKQKMVTLFDFQTNLSGCNVIIIMAYVMVSQVNECSRPACKWIAPNRLPNILVHIVHYYRYKGDWKSPPLSATNQPSGGSSQQSSQPSTSHQSTDSSNAGIVWVNFTYSYTCNSTTELQHSWGGCSLSQWV